VENALVLTRRDMSSVRLLSGMYYYNGTGSSTHVYVLDTGIHKSHQDFQGRADWQYNAADGSANCEDGHGHGTHCAGTVGGATYGLAKAVHLHAVKVLDDSGAGSDSTVGAGIDWVVKNAVFPAVISMSLGGPVSSTLDTMVKNAVKLGIVIVVAAGNSNEDACNSSPAHVDVVITVAASTENDDRASFSNFGSCVTLFAPGTNIVSASNADDTSSRTLSGTSMSTPHVAGAVAIYLSRHPTATPDQVKADLICYATNNGITDVQGSPNRLLYSIIKGGAPTDSGLPSGSSLNGPTGGQASATPTGNNQNEQCTSSSSCQGPFTATLASSNAVQRYVYNTTQGGGYHRAWLNYNTGGGSILAPQNVQNTLSLMKFDDSSKSWSTVASATDSNNAKNIMYQDTAASSTPGSTWAWYIQAVGYTPSKITTSYKLPDATPTPEPQPAPSTVDQCSATTYFDPDPSDPNNVGQNPNGNGVGAMGGGVNVMALMALLATAIMAMK
jgi:subtilisin family serine protease